MLLVQAHAVLGLLGLHVRLEKINVNSMACNGWHRMLRRITWLERDYVSIRGGGHAIVSVKKNAQTCLLLVCI